MNLKTFMKGSHWPQILFDGVNKIFGYKFQFHNNYHTYDAENSWLKGLNMNATLAYSLHPGSQQYSKHSGRGKKADQHKLCKCPLRCSFFN